MVTGSDHAILDGFTITGGNARGSDPDWYGGGMYNMNAAPLVRNCAFVGNTAYSGSSFGSGQGEGGGIYNKRDDGASGRVVTISHCVFEDNVGGGISNQNIKGEITDCIFHKNVGGGMLNGEVSLSVSNSLFISNMGPGVSSEMMGPSEDYVFRNCIFAGNSQGGILAFEANTPRVEGCIFSGNFNTEDYAGGIENYDGAAMVERSIFSGNWTKGSGGAYRLGYSVHVSDVALKNNVFVGNVARKAGGAISNTLRTLAILNSTFYGNKAYGQGGAVYSDGFSTVSIDNSILWDDSPREIDAQDAIFTVSYSDVKNGQYASEGDLNEDPRFAPVANNSGAWTGVAYDETLYQTALQDNTKSWSNGSLKNMFVTTRVSSIPPSDNPTDPLGLDGGVKAGNETDELSFYIADNNADTIFIWGDFTAHILPGDEYSIIDLRLSPDSLCIDAADDAAAPDTDILGQKRVDAAGKGADGVFADIGAYEFVE